MEQVVAPTAFNALLESGVLGAIAVIAVIWAYRKDREAREARAILQQKTEAAVERYHALSTDLNLTLKSILDLLKGE